MNKTLNGLKPIVISVWEATRILDIARSRKTSLSLCNNHAPIYPLLASLMSMIHHLLFNLKLSHKVKGKLHHRPPNNRNSNNLHPSNTPYLTIRRLRCEALNRTTTMLHLTIHKTSNCIKHLPARPVHIKARSQA